MRDVAALLALAALCAAAPRRTPNAFLQAGTPTFVTATGGSSAANRAVREQIEFIRSLLFPKARVVEDREVDPSKGPFAWPSRPVLYGGPKINLLLAKLTLPFRIEKEAIVIGGETFQGKEYRVITVVPPLDAAPGRPGHPAFLLYAGAGTPGIAGINAVPHGADEILIVDRFGRLAVGRYEGDPEHGYTARITGKNRRLPWRERKAADGLVVARLKLAAPATAAEEREDAALARGYQRAVAKLNIRKPCGLTVYVYPDRKSKQIMDGNGGDGNADLVSDTLHVLKADPSVLEPLVAHEATHVLAYRAFGPPGTALFGEGLAVWVAGGYGGSPLSEWKAALAGKRPTPGVLLKRFRRLDERISYPAAGLLTQELIEKKGLDAFLKTIYAAGPETLRKVGFGQD